MKNTILYIWFQLAVGICNRLAGEILAKFDNILDVYNCDDFGFLGEKYEKYIKRLENKDTANAFEVLKRCENLGVRVTGYYDDLYPEALRRIKIPPAVLYSIGNFKDLNNVPCVAIVGTRKISDYGRTVAENFSYTLSKSGAYIISGLAKGIDTAAHRGAVMADGYTIAVLGNPIGDVYPKENLRAFETLYERGLVISEMYPGCPRTRGDFPNRNRIISGLSDVVVIAEAGEGSGALITARHAIEQGRLLFAVPGAIGADNAGTNQLIKTGVPAATEPQDILSPLAMQYPEVVHSYIPAVTSKLRSYGNAEKPKVKIIKETQTPSFDEVSPETPKNDLSGSVSEKIISELNKNKPMTADEIVAKTGLSVSEVMTELTLMEIDGSVIASVGGRYTVRRI